MIVAVILALVAFMGFIVDVYIYEFVPPEAIPNAYDYILTAINDNFLQPIFTGLGYIKDFLFLIIEKAQEVIERLLNIAN